MYFIVASSVLVLISIASRCAGAPALSPSEFLDVAGTSIAVGPDHACVLQRIRGLDYGGRSLCWGLEYHYKGGINPQAYDSEEIYIQVISGYRFSCGITLDQNVHCWGVLSTYAPKGLFNQLASSNRRLFACGVKVDGSISCFGKDHSRVKKLQGKIDNDKNRVYVQVSCASDHCCGLDVSGQTHCWGDFRFDYGQGTPPKTRKAVAVGMDGEILQEEEAEEDGYADGEQPEDPDDFEHVIFRQIAVTEQSSCGIRFKDNAIECWGNHRIAHGEIHPGPFRQLTVGQTLICGLHADDDTLHCIDGRKNREPSWMLSNFDHSQGFDQISISGEGQTCAVTMDSELKCFDKIGYTETPDVEVA